MTYESLFFKSDRLLVLNTLNQISSWQLAVMENGNHPNRLLVDALENAMALHGKAAIPGFKFIHVKPNLRVLN